jgi:hypothetical protein
LCPAPTATRQLFLKIFLSVLLTVLLAFAVSFVIALWLMPRPGMLPPGPRTPQREHQHKPAVNAKTDAWTRRMSDLLEAHARSLAHTVHDRDPRAQRSIRPRARPDAIRCDRRQAPSAIAL